MGFSTLYSRKRNFQTVVVDAFAYAHFLLRNRQKWALKRSCPRIKNRWFYCVGQQRWSCCGLKDPGQPHLNIEGAPSAGATHEWHCTLALSCFTQGRYRPLRGGLEALVLVQSLAYIDHRLRLTTRGSKRPGRLLTLHVTNGFN